MSAVMSKRQQARNEKLLQELVQNVPGNNRCADCQMSNPAWASWSLGVFLCMRCAAIHRKLGTHISKVKSLSMDSWSNEQVDNMRKVGNAVSNQVYNPDNKRPPVPVNADEAESAMERFIRQKYVNNVAKDGGKLRSSRSDEGTPPPLPPKNSTKFGFRSASSIFPLSSRAKKEAKLAAALVTQSDAFPGLTNKPSKVFGASVDLDEADDAEKKLARLRDMGFNDMQRNSIILKGVNGSVERAVEALVRLGEGSSPLQAMAMRENGLRISRSMTPLTPFTSPTSPTSDANGGFSGLNVSKNAAPARPTSASMISPSTNPFNMMPTAQPQTAHSTGSLRHDGSYGGLVGLSTNPFEYTPQRVDAVSQAFQTLSVSASQQTIFPHLTGDVGAQGLQQPSAYQVHTSSSTPTSPCNYPLAGFQTSLSYPQPGPQRQQPLSASHKNPFYNLSPSAMQLTNIQQSQSVGGPYLVQGSFANNPYARSPNRIASPALGQIPEQMQTSFLSASPQPLAASVNSLFAGSIQAPQAQQTGQQQLLAQSMAGQQAFYGQQQPEHHVPRYDKASIMALYDQPYRGFHKLASEPTLPTQQPNPTGVGDQPVHKSLSVQAPVSSSDGLRSVSQPITYRSNPFISDGGATTTKTVPLSTRDSVSFGQEMTWSNGRHSPDAFASLSARHV